MFLFYGRKCFIIIIFFFGLFLFKRVELLINPSLTELFFVTRLTKGGGLDFRYKPPYDTVIGTYV